MPIATPLQARLLERQPQLQWLIGPDGAIMEPLLHQWGMQAYQSLIRPQPFADILDVFHWGIEQDVATHTLQPTFNWLHRCLVQTPHALPKDADSFLVKLRTTHPQLLQTLLANLSLNNSVWDTSFLLKYAPDPQSAWQEHKEWHAFYTGTTPLHWCRKETIHANSCTWARPDKEALVAMRQAMGDKPFALWQYGAYMSILGQNQVTPTSPAGNKYNLGAALTLLEPAMEIGCAPEPKTLALDTVRRYKGKDLVNDMLAGLHHTMNRYEEQSFQLGLDYGSTMLNAIVPFAIAENLAGTGAALSLDKQITDHLHHKRLSADIAQEWFDARLTQESRKSTTLDFPQLLPLWPKAIQDHLLRQEIEYQLQVHPGRMKGFSDSECLLARLREWSFKPAVTSVFVDQLTPQQWADLQQTLDNNDSTSDVLALLQANHPRIDAYKSSLRARVAVVAACMVYIDKKDYMHDPKYRTMAGLFYVQNQTPIGQLSLPQPLYYFATVFPQYRDTWQRLACDMATQMADVKLHPQSDASEKSNRIGAKNVVNALASLMLGHPVDAEGMLAVHESLDSEMSYEALVQTQLTPNEAFELPATFDEYLFASNSPNH